MQRSEIVESPSCAQRRGSRAVGSEAGALDQLKAGGIKRKERPREMESLLPSPTEIETYPTGRSVGHARFTQQGRLRSVREMHIQCPRTRRASAKQTDVIGQPTS